MKRDLLTIILAILTFPIFAQELSVIQSTRYFKTVEPNRTIDGGYNFADKNEEERLLFGDFNAHVEFVLAPSFDGMSGLRIYRDSSSQSFVLEVKRIINWKEVNEYINKAYANPSSGGIKVLLSQEQDEQIRERSRLLNERIKSDRLSRYRIQTSRSPIGDSLKNILYFEIKDIISSTSEPCSEKAIGINYPNAKDLKTEDSLVIVQTVTLTEDGTSSTLRCVVGNQLWTLKNHVTEGKQKDVALKLNQIIKEVEAGTFNESKYLEALN